MAHLPPVTWQDVATKQDLNALGSELRTEMAELRTEMAELRGEMADLRGEVRTDLAGFRGELATMGATLQSRIDQAITRQTWRLATFFGAGGALMVTVVSLVR